MYSISGFYKFKKISDIKKNKRIIQIYFTKKGIRGTVIISDEGINGTISAKKKNLDFAIIKIKKTFKFNNFDSINLSMCNYQPFHRGKVKIKKEVVPLGIKIAERKSKNHIDPTKWNRLIRDKKTFLLDARKPFEYKVGSFKRSIILTFLKNILHPLIAFTMSKFFLNLDELLVMTVTLAAALPSGSQTYYFAFRYNSQKELVSSNIVLSTFVSFFTLSILIILFDF